MSEKKYEADVRQPVDIKQETKGLVKDWLLFIGDIIKASVEGVVEFWGKKEEPAEEPVAEPLPEETEETPEEEPVEAETEPVDEEISEEETPEEEVVLSRRERRRARREARRARRLARKEERRAKREAKKAAKAAKKAAKLGLDTEDAKAVEEKTDKKADKKADKKDKKAKKAEKPEKISRRRRYVTKDLVMMKRERAFYDGIKAAVGVRYVVKARVPLNTVVKRADGKRCKKEENLGQMDFGVFDLKNRLRVLVEVRGMRRKGRQSRKMYRRARRICRRTGIPVITFWAKYGVIPSYIKSRMKDYMKLL